MELAKNITLEDFGFISKTTPFGGFSVQQGDSKKGIPLYTK
jgi:hypothetical protein